METNNAHSLNEQDTTTVSRRTLLQGAALLATGFAASRSMAAEHDHSAMTGHMALVEAALHCKRDGLACMQHLQALLVMGDTSLANCLAGVNDMLAICEPLITMASNHSTNLPALAAVAATISEECEAVCRMHAAEHAQCATLADSCAECARECRAVAA
jgi:Cys-rich four helix bundle protein (predicted Tat secretion target)